MATSWPVAREESLEGLPQPPARRGCFISGIMVAFECESRMPKDARFGVPVQYVHSEACMYLIEAPVPSSREPQKL